MLQSIFPSGWQQFLIGGLAIGAGVSLMFICFGRVVGMSSFFSSTWSWMSARSYFQRPDMTGSRQWRLWCALGLILGAFLWLMTADNARVLTTSVGPLRLLLGGLLVGYGARLSNGCTSGHGICGLSSLSGPAALAVAVFMGVAIITANLMMWLTGVQP